MKIFGVSQSSGEERVLKIERGIDGIVLTLADIKGGKERGRIKINSDALLGEILDPVPGGSIIEGMPQAHEGAMRLEIEVRRNEVLLQIRENNGIVADIAIGLDDIQDGLQRVTHRESIGS